MFRGGREYEAFQARAIVMGCLVASRVRVGKTAIDSFCEQIAASNCRRQLLPAIVGSNLQNKLFSQIVA